MIWCNRFPRWKYYLKSPTGQLERIVRRYPRRKKTNPFVPDRSKWMKSTDLLRRTKATYELINSITPTIALSAYFFFQSVASFAGPTQERSYDNLIDLVYGYRYSDSFLSKDLEDYLRRGYDLDVRISFEQTLRDNSWYTDPEKMSIYFAAGDCVVDALSLPSASMHWIDLYATQRFFRPIDPTDVETYAPNYYANILSHPRRNFRHFQLDDGWYALPGYRYVFEKSEFIVATTKTIGSDELNFKSKLGPKYIQSRAVSLSELTEALKRDRSEAISGHYPYLAWSDFEHSFAPLYGAFGIGTIGRNLLSVGVNGLPLIEGHPAQIHPRFRDAIGVLREWYEERLFDPQFFDTDYYDAYQNARYTTFLSTPRGPTVLAPNRLFREFSNDHETITFFQVRGDERTAQSLDRSPFQGAEAYSWCVSEGEMEPLLRLFEYTRLPSNDTGSSSGGGWLARVFGLEGLHYEVGAGGEIVPYRVGAIPSLLGVGRDSDDYAMWHFKRVPEITLQSRDELRILGADHIYAEAAILDFELLGSRPIVSPVLDEIDLDGDSSQLSELSRYVKERVMRWITHDQEISDSDWNAYVDGWNDILRGQE